MPRPSASASPTCNLGSKVMRCSQYCEEYYQYQLFILGLSCVFWDFLYSSVWIFRFATARTPVVPKQIRTQDRGTKRVRPLVQ